MKWSCSAGGQPRGSGQGPEDLSHEERLQELGQSANWRRDIFGMTEQQLSNACLEAVGMEPGSAQCHVMAEQEAMGINSNYKVRGIISQAREKLAS